MEFQDNQPASLPSSAPRGGEGRPSYFGTPRPYKTPTEKAREKSKGVGGGAHSILKPAQEKICSVQPVAIRASKICTRCGTASASPEMPGSGWIELLLWMYILPGLIYSIWRRSKKSESCPACGCKELIPMATPAGQRLVQQYHPEGVPPTIFFQEPPKPTSKLVVFGVLFFMAFMLYSLGGFRS